MKTIATKKTENYFVHFESEVVTITKVDEKRWTFFSNEDNKT
jgi:hypothetical protein